MQYILVGFAFYFVMVSLITIFYYFYTRTATSGNYSNMLLGNRSVSYILTAFSAHASDMSDWLFMAFPAALYSLGMVSAWIAIGLILGMLASWQFVAPQLRKATEKLDAITLSSYFEKRFKDDSGIIRLISALMSVLFFAVYIAAGLKGLGFLCEAVFGIPYIFGIILGLSCAILFITFGGYKALAWVDLFQALFLLLIIIIVPFYAYLHVGGWSNIVSAAHDKNIPLNFFPSTNLGLLNTIFLSISWGVGYFGTPHILTKFMGISDVKEINKAKYVGMVWQVCVLTLAGLTGLIGIAYFPHILANKELIFVEIVKDLFSSLAAGFILSAVAGATLSVITAQILVLISVLIEDLYKYILRPRATEKELIFVYRLFVFIIAIMSFYVSLEKSTTIQQLVQYAWMGFACTFSPLVLLSLHGNYINKYGAIACVSVGALVAMVWQIYFKNIFLTSFGLDIPSVIAAFILSIAFAYFVSYLTRTR
ncbi:MAG: sodium/proline symporter [Candidatus Babeliales bacterium]|nr:sodium/proline symporter [Candidatus Babeliales bacterium]